MPAKRLTEPVGAEPATPLAKSPACGWRGPRNELERSNLLNKLDKHKATCRPTDTTNRRPVSVLSVTPLVSWLGRR